MEPLACSATCPCEYNKDRIELAFTQLSWSEFTFIFQFDKAILIFRMALRVKNESE